MLANDAFAFKVLNFKKCIEEAHVLNQNISLASFILCKEALRFRQIGNDIEFVFIHEYCCIDLTVNSTYCCVFF